MLKIDNHNIVLTGNSVDYYGMALAHFNASFYGAPEINTTVNIINYNMNDEQKEVFFSDLTNFYQTAIDKVTMITAGDVATEVPSINDEIFTPEDTGTPMTPPVEEVMPEEPEVETIPEEVVNDEMETN